MQRYSNISPRARLTPQIRQPQLYDDPANPVLGLQQKLQNLEVKYSNFVEKCAILLKTTQRKSEKNDLFSEYSSSICNSPDFSDPSDDKLMEILKEIEDGFLLKDLMDKISDVVFKSQEKIFRCLQGFEKQKVKVKECLNYMLGDLWEILFENENSVQGIFKTCVQKIAKFSKVHSVESFRSPSKIKLKQCKAKYKECLEQKEFYMNKVKEQHECLKKIQKDHNELKQKIFTNSILVDTKRNSANSFRTTFEQLIYSGSRSHTASPGAILKEDFEKLKEKNIQLKTKLRSLTSNHTTLAEANRKSGASSDYKSDSYEIEKREIQGQLKNLQRKLIGFEKIAKNLIDTSIRTELTLIDKKDRSKQNLSRHLEAADSSEISILNSHCSLLEADQLQKNLESLEKEKVALASALKSEKKESEKNLKEIVVMGARIRELDDEISRIRQENEALKPEILSLFNHKAALEESNRKFIEQVKEISDSKRNLQEKIKEKDNSIDELKAEISSLKLNYSVLTEKSKSFKQTVKEVREEKTKLISLSAKHASNVSALECTIEELRMKQSKLLHELEETKKANDSLEIQNSELLCKLEYVHSIEEVKEELMITQERLDKALSDLLSCQSQAEKQAEALKGEIKTIKDSAERKIQERNNEIKAVKEEFRAFKEKYDSALKESMNGKETIKNLNEANKKLAAKNIEDNKQDSLLNSCIEELSEKIAFLEMKLKEAEIEKKKLEKIVEGNNEKIKTLTNERVDLLNKVNARMVEEKSEQGNLEKQSFERLEMLQENLKEYQTSIEKLKKCLEVKTSEIESLTMQLSSLNISNGVLKASNETLEKLVNDKDLIISSLHSSAKVEENQKNLQLLNRQLQLRENELKHAQEMIDVYEKQISEISEQFKSYKEQQETHMKEIVQTLEDGLKQKSKEVSDLVKAAKITEENLKKQHEKLLTDLEDRVREIGELNFMIKNNENEYARSATKFQNQLNHQKRELEKAAEIIGKLTKTIQNNEVEIKESREKEKSVQACLKEANENILRLEEDLEREKKNLEKANVSVEELRKTLQSSECASKENSEFIKGLKDTIEKLEIESYHSTSNIEQLQKKLNQESLDLEKSFATINKQTKLIQSKEDSIKSLRKVINLHNTSLHYIIPRFRSSFTNLKKELTTLLSHIFSEVSAQLESQLSLFVQKYFDLESQNKSLARKIEAYEIQVKDESSSFTSKIETILIENKFLSGRVLMLETEEAELLRDFNNREHCLLEKIQEYECSANELAEKLSREEEMKNELKRVGEDSKSKQNEFLGIIEESKKTIKELSKKIEEFKNNQENDHMKFIEKNRQIVNLTDKIDELENHLIDLNELKGKVSMNKREFQQLDKENQQLLKRIEEKNKYIEDVADNFSRISKEKEDLSVLTQQLQEENKKLYGSLSYSMSEIEKVREENSRLLISSSRNSYDAQHSLEENSTRLAEEAEKQRIENNKLLKSLSNLESETKELRKHLETSSKLASDYEKLENNFIQLELHCKGLEKSISTKESILDELRELLTAKEEEIEHLKVRILKLEESFKQSAAARSSKQTFSYEMNREILEAPRFLDVESLPPLPVRGKTGSFSSKQERSNSKRSSEFNEGINITSCKVVKTYGFAGKKWQLLQNDNGSLCWADYNDSLTCSEGDEIGEDIDTIKACLGNWYMGSITESIENLKQKAAKELSFSFKEEALEQEMRSADFNMHFFHGDLFDAGLEISGIGQPVEEHEMIDQLKADITRKEAKIEKKKRTVLLHKEQIVVLKDQMRKMAEELKTYQDVCKDFEVKIQNAMAVNLPYLKQVYSNLISKLKVEKSTEDLIGVLYRLMNFSEVEIQNVQGKRKGSKKR